MTTAEPDAELTLASGAETRPSGLRRLGRVGPAWSLYERALAILVPRVADDHPTLVAARQGLSTVDHH